MRSVKTALSICTAVVCLMSNTAAAAAEIRPVAMTLSPFIGGYAFKVAIAQAKVVVLAFEDVHFEFNQSTLTPEAKILLKRNIALLKENPGAKIRIAGCTSAAGSKEYNQLLSERRSKSVQDYLVNEVVIVPDRLTTIGYGETNPARYEASPKEIYSTAAKANMRVLFEIIIR